MSSWLAGLLGSLIVGLPTITATWLTYRAATRANRAAAEEKRRAAEAAAEERRRAAELDERKVDQVAFDTAQGIYERGIAEAQREIGRVRADLDAARREAVQLRTDLDAERRETGRLRSRVLVLERLITANGIPLPNHID